MWAISSAWTCQCTWQTQGPSSSKTQTMRKFITSLTHDSADIGHRRAPNIGSLLIPEKKFLRIGSFLSQRCLSPIWISLRAGIWVTDCGRVTRAEMRKLLRFWGSDGSGSHPFGLESRWKQAVPLPGL